MNREDLWIFLAERYDSTLFWNESRLLATMHAGCRGHAALMGETDRVTVARGDCGARVSRQFATKRPQRHPLSEDGITAKKGATMAGLPH
jgi:hypothetical protein